MLVAEALELPPAAFTTGRLTESTSNFRQVITRTTDPVQLFFTEIPNALSKPIEKPVNLLRALKKCIDELENVASAYTEQACDIVRSALMVPGELQKNLASVIYRNNGRAIFQINSLKAVGWSCKGFIIQNVSRL